MREDVQDGSGVGLLLRWLVQHIHIPVAQPPRMASFSGHLSKIAKRGLEAPPQIYERLPVRRRLADRSGGHQVSPDFDVADHVLQRLPDRSMPDVEVLIELLVG